MSARLAEDPAIIAALEARASRSPRLYRFWLALIAIAGDFALTLVLVFPVAALIVVSVSLYATPTLIWLGVAAIAFFVWVFRPGFRLPERGLKEPAPKLHAELEALKQKLRVPGRMTVYLDDEFNAAALQTRGYFGVVGTRSGLILGVPLLLALSREQVLAIVAHEFGHFSRRHGLLGQWLYRARVGWIEYTKQVQQSDSALDVAAAALADEFLPYFSARSFVLSRQCEYEADADAALAVGAPRFAEALSRTVAVGHYWDAELPRRIDSWRRESPEPPSDFLERFAKDLAARSSTEVEEWLAKGMRAPSSWIDTHPSLADRLRAVKEAPVLSTPTVCAGQEFFGDAWPRIVAEFDEKWRKEAQLGWFAHHLRLKHVVQPLLQATDEQILGWDVERRLAHAVALRETDAPAGLARLRELHEANPQHKRVRFAFASALLKERDEEGVGLMHILVREDPAFRLEGFQRVLAYYEEKGNSRQIRRWSTWVKKLRPLVAKASYAFTARVEDGGGRASSLPAGERAVIAEAAQRDRCVAGAWLLEGETDLTYADDRKPIAVGAHVLALAVDSEQATKLQMDEDSIGRRYKQLLRGAVPPDEIVAIRTFFTTEGRPALYAPNCEFALFSTDETRLKASAGFEKCDWQ